MTSFVIDTGTAGINLGFDTRDWLVEHVMSFLPPDPTQAQIDGAMVQAITGELRGPKKSATVRRRWCQLWPLIAPLAEREPEQFDALFLEYLDCIDATR